MMSGLSEEDKKLIREQLEDRKLIQNELIKKRMEMEQGSIFGKMGLGVPTESMRDFAAGGLQELKETGELLQSAIPPKGWSPFKSFQPSDLSRTTAEMIEGGQPAPGISRAESMNTWLQKFSPYQAMGVEKKPYETPGGARQFVGQYVLPITMGGKGIVDLGTAGIRALGSAASRLWPRTSESIIRGITEAPQNIATHMLDQLGGGSRSTAENANQIAQDLYRTKNSAVNANVQRNLAPVQKVHWSDKINNVPDIPFEEIDPRITHLHQILKNNPTVGNAHRLQTVLGEWERKLKNANTDAERKLYSKILNYKNSVIDEINNVLPKNMQNNYFNFRKHHAKIEETFATSPTIKEAASGQNMSPVGISSEFAPISPQKINPYTGRSATSDLNKINAMIPDITKDRILYDLVQGHNNEPRALYDKIQSALRGAHGKYVSNETERLHNMLGEALEQERQLSGHLGRETARRRRTRNIGLTAAGIVGIPTGLVSAAALSKKIYNLLTES